MLPRSAALLLVVLLPTVLATAPAPVEAQDTVAAASPAAACPWPATPGLPWADTAAAVRWLSARGAGADAAPERLLAVGDSAYAQGIHTAAYAAYARAALDSATFEALWKTARAAVDVGQGITDEDAAHRWYRLGETWARRAIQAAPDRPEGHFVLGEALGLVALDLDARRRVRMAGEIRKEALAAVATDSGYAGGWHLLGRWNQGVMELSGPARFFAKAFLGGQVFGEASWEKAERYLVRASGLEPRRIVHHLELGKVYMETDRPGWARAEFDTTLTLPPADEQDCDYLEEARKLLAELKG